MRYCHRYFRANPLANMSNSTKLSVQRLSENAFLPTKATKFAAGVDLYSAHHYRIEPQNKQLIKTDLAIAIPANCYGRLAPRSSLAMNSFIHVGAGVIDSDYRGNISVLLFNFNKTAFLVKPGDKIAQLILERIYQADIIESNNLDNTSRGSRGFGSSGSSALCDSQLM